MGIRQDQHMGLNAWARDFVNGIPVLDYTEEITRIYPSGEKTTFAPIKKYKNSVEKDVYKFYEGMFGDEHPLYKYVFPDGEKYYEEVQSSPWSSGPVFFIALKNDKGEWVKESLWTDAEIDNA